MLRDEKIEFEIIFYFSANVVGVAFFTLLFSKETEAAAAFSPSLRPCVLWDFTSSNPPGQFLQTGFRDPQRITRGGASMTTKFTAGPPQVRSASGSWDPPPALPLPGAQDGGVGGNSNPSSAHTRAQEPQFPRSVK